MKKQLTTMVTLILFTVLFFGCGSDESNDDSRTAVKVEGYKVEQKQTAQTYSFAGNVEGERRVTLSTKLMGRVANLPFEEGDKVSKGQTIIKIDNKDLLAKKAQIEAGYVEARAAYTNTKKNYDRIKNLFDKGSATQKEMDDVTSGYKMVKAKLNAVEEMKNEIENTLTYAEIKSPFTGYVTKKFVQTGDMANPGMPLLTVENLSAVKVRASVPESEIKLFSKNDKVKVIVDAIPNGVFEGTVIQIDAGANPASRQFTLLVKVDNSNFEIKSGMYANVILEKGKKESVVIPKSYLIERGQLKGVYTVNQNSEVMLRWVRVGKSNSEGVEVLSGLGFGETIIAVSENIREGQKVEVQL